jgi:hypothetical protein
MSTQHPITPPPELVEQWSDIKPMEAAVVQNWVKIAALAARWGADQELEACCKWLDERAVLNGATALRTARRPKPPSVKEQALADLLEIYTSEPFPVGDSRFNRIRRALEALPND